MSRESKSTQWGAEAASPHAPADFKISDDLYMFAGFGNVGLAITPEGLVVMDTSMRLQAPAIIERIRALTDLPFHTIIYTHGHLDHAGGAEFFMEDAKKNGHPRPRVIAHENVVRRFNRYAKTYQHQWHMNRVQYGVNVEEDNTEPDDEFSFSVMKICYPDTTFSRGMSFKLGELTFDIHHAKGETDDHLWIHIPERETVVAGDMVKKSMPNVGNPFKSIIRYDVEWAEGQELIAGLKPAYLIPGHREVMTGDEAIQVCADQSRFLRMVHDQVIELMNQGCFLEEVLERVSVPAELLEGDALRQIYGCLEFVIHGVYNRYAGWYPGRPSQIFPSKFADIAAQMVLASGPGALHARVLALEEAGELQLALHLAETLAEGAADAASRKAGLLTQARLMDRLAEKTVNGMARNTLLRAAAMAERQAEKL